MHTETLSSIHIFTTDDYFGITASASYLTAFSGVNLLFYAQDSMAHFAHFLPSFDSTSALDTVNAHAN